MSPGAQKFVDFVKRNPIGVSCAVVSIALAAAVYLRWDKIDAATVVRDEKDSLSQKLAQNNENAHDLDDQLAELIKDNKAIDGRLLSLTKGGASYLRYFYQLSTDVPGIKVIDVNPGPASKSALGPVAFTVNLQGTYTQLVNVLRRLESGEYFCRITNLTLNKPMTGEDAAGDVISMRISLELLGQQ